MNTSDRSVGTITDVDGTFTLAAAKGDILEISSLGYTTTKVTVGESGDITVILQEDSEFLSEAVVVGYGTIKKKDLTGAVASVSDKDLKDTPVANVGQALQGDGRSGHLQEDFRRLAASSGRGHHLQQAQRRGKQSQIRTAHHRFLPRHLVCQGI